LLASAQPPAHKAAQVDYLTLDLQAALDTLTTTSCTRKIVTPPRTDDDQEPTDLVRALIAPESWKILNKAGEYCDLVKLESLISAVSQVQAWLRAWPSTGLLPFIHPNIYGADRMPTFLQDAYTVCATYYISGPSTKTQLFRIIERNIETLILGVEPDTTMRSGPCCLVYHLARVQALLIYQTIRLYDDDTSQRLAAEKHSPLLNEWGYLMVDCALQSSNYVRSFPENPKPDDEAAWQAWCLAESIRRTWVACCVVQGTYLVMKGEGARCPGHLKFTAQMGLWDAKSAHAWKVAQKVSGVVLYETMNGHHLKARARAGEFDEFGLWALKVTMGKEAFQV
jgi:hypothetical protein